jgi:hypothetical protein
VTPVDCTCDAGTADGGICPNCYGWGWYLTSTGWTAENIRRVVARTSRIRVLVNLGFELQGADAKELLAALDAWKADAEKGWKWASPPLNIEYAADLAAHRALIEAQP